MPDKNDGYFRVRYKKLDSPCKLSNGLRSDLKFDIDANNTLVFSLYPEFETLSDKAIVGNEWEALDEGTAIIRKPYWEYSNDYFDILSSRVNVGAKACLVAGSHQIAELEIIDIYRTPTPHQKHEYKYIIKSITYILLILLVIL